MAIIINIKIKLLPREYTVTINSVDVNRKIKTGLTKMRMSIESLLNAVPIIGVPLKKMFVAIVKHLPTVNVNIFKFSNEYVILVNTDKKLAPYMNDVKTLVSTHAERVEDLRSVAVLPAHGDEENPSADLKIILIREKEEYSEETGTISNGKTVKTIVSGKNKLKTTFPNLNADILLSKGLVLYGDEFLKEWCSQEH
jgi:hypothetical protein